MTGCKGFLLLVRMENIKLESVLNTFDDFSKINLNEFNNEFIMPYIEMKDRIKAIYVNSDLNMPYAHETADWINIFLAIVSGVNCSKIENKDQKESIFKTIESISEDREEAQETLQDLNWEESNKFV